MAKRRYSFKKMRLLLRVLAAAWHVRPLAITGFFAAAALEIAAFIGSIYATSRLAGLLAAYSAGTSTDAIWWWLAADIMAVSLIGIAHWCMSWAKRLLYFRTTTWAIDQFHAAMCRLDIQDFYEDTIRNQINKAQEGYPWRIGNLIESVLELIYGIVRFLVTAAVVAQISWWLIPVIGVLLIPSLLVNGYMAKIQWFVFDDEGDSRHIFWGLEWLIRQVKNQMELRSGQARRYVLDKVHAMNIAFYRKQEAKIAKPNRFIAPAKLLEVGGTAVGSVIALQQFLTGKIALEQYFFLSGALVRVSSGLNSIFGTLARLQEPLLFAENFFAVIDRQPSIVDKPNAVALRGDVAPEIVFENVDFIYPGQQTPVFSKLSLRIAPGEHVAIVGENGAGKTTLIKLLMRFYRPTGGRILIGGHDLQDVAIESWYAHVATLFQEFNRYPFPISENIEIGLPAGAGNKRRLAEAAKFSNVDDFVKKYEHGWETVLDNSFEKGVEPSGGQWQRVALARAFYRRASVLVLDEPTAAIDAKAEYDIFNNIFGHYQNKTAIIVSHRFSTVRRAHTILVIDKGKIVQRGSHTDLMKNKGGLYHELFSKQAEGYK